MNTYDDGTYQSDRNNEEKLYSIPENYEYDYEVNTIMTQISDDNDEKSKSKE